MELSRNKVKAIELGKEFLSQLTPLVSELFDGLLTLKLGIYLIRGLGNEILDQYKLSKKNDIQEEVEQIVYIVRELSKTIKKGSNSIRGFHGDVREFLSQDSSTASYPFIRNMGKFFNKIFLELEVVLNGLYNNIILHEKLIQGATFIDAKEFNKSKLIALQRRLEKNIAEAFANLKKGNIILKELRVQMENV